MNQPIKLEFSEKYSREHSQQYLEKHEDSWSRRLSTYYEQLIAARALNAAGQPQVVLDLPCGAGRFWKLLLKDPKRRLFAADNSPHMLEVARANQAAELVERAQLFETSAFDIDMADQSVDCIFSIRLMHHVGESEHRLAVLKECHRVSRDTVILSLWVDGNFKSWKRKRLDAKRNAQGGRKYQNRFVLEPKQVEHEFTESGFEVIKYFDEIPLYSMWRTYVLRKGPSD